MAFIHLYDVWNIFRRFSTFVAAHCFLTLRNFRHQTVNVVLYVVTFALITFIHLYHWHVQNAYIHCCSQELLPFLSVIDHFLPRFTHQLLFHPPSLHLAIYFLVYLWVMLLHKFIHNTFLGISSHYKEMLTQTAVTEYQKKISEEYNSINLNIRRFCAAHKRTMLLKAVSLWTGKKFWSVRVWEARKKERVQQAQKVYKSKNESIGTVQSLNNWEYRAVKWHTAFWANSSSVRTHGPDFVQKWVM